MIRPAANSYGMSSGSCRCTGLTANAIKKPSRKTAATANGATQIEGYSHNSRRIDQYMRRVHGMIAGAVTCDLRGDSGTALERVLIEPLLAPRRFDCRASPTCLLRCSAIKAARRKE